MKISDLSIIFTSKLGKTLYFSLWVKVFSRRFRISDPTPVTRGMQPRRNRGVRCIRFVRRIIHSPVTQIANPDTLLIRPPPETPTPVPLKVFP